MAAALPLVALPVVSLMGFRVSIPTSRPLRTGATHLAVHRAIERSLYASVSGCARQATGTGTDLAASADAEVWGSQEGTGTLYTGARRSACSTQTG